MKKNISFVFLILIIGSIMYGESLSISIVIPDAYKLNIDAPNSVSLGVSDISTKVMDVASSTDGPWYQVEVVDFIAGVEISSLSHKKRGRITIHAAKGEKVDSVKLSLVLCDSVDESLCFFIEERVDITDSHRQAGEVTVTLSPGEN